MVMAVVGAVVLPCEVKVTGGEVETAPGGVGGGSGNGDGGASRPVRHSASQSVSQCVSRCFTIDIGLPAGHPLRQPVVSHLATQPVIQLVIVEFRRRQPTSSLPFIQPVIDYNLENHLISHSLF